VTIAEATALSKSSPLSLRTRFSGLVVPPLQVGPIFLYFSHFSEKNSRLDLKNF
jgi:hypothetical protein